MRKQQKWKTRKSVIPTPTAAICAEIINWKGLLSWLDGKHCIILDTFATAGDVNDSQLYIARLDATTQRFQFTPKTVGIDAGHFTTPIAESLAHREILGMLGYRRPTKGKNSLRKQDVTYDANKDCYLSDEASSPLPHHHKRRLSRL